MTCRCGRGSPGTGPRGLASQAAAPLSVISGSTPKASRTASASPRRVPRMRCSRTAAVTAARSAAVSSVSCGNPVDEAVSGAFVTGSSAWPAVSGASVSAPTQLPSQRVKSAGASDGVK